MAEDSRSDDKYIDPLYTKKISKAITFAEPFIVWGRKENSAKVSIQYPYSITNIFAKYSHQSGNNRVPNVDINQVRIKIDSWKEARTVMKSILRKFASVSIDSEEMNGEEKFWIAFQIDDLTNPVWWNKRKKVSVPTYDQLIISSGYTSIGIHYDLFGDCRTPVDTYLTVLCGKKLVIMIPPTPEGTEFFTKYENAPFPFPEIPAELLEEIKSLGGYYFEICPDGEDPVTLFVPKSWYHWLLNVSPYSIFLSGSQF